MFNILLSLITALTCVATAVGFLGRHWWVFELASHYRVQYFFLLLACGLLFLGVRLHRKAVLAIVFALVNFPFVGAYQGGTPVQASLVSGEGRTLRALLVNVNHDNREYAKLDQFIRSTGPDFIVLLEVNKAWMNSLNPLLPKYPYAMVKPAVAGGIVLLSRIPFKDAAMRTIGAVGLPSVIAQFSVGEEHFTLIGTHPYAPTSRTGALSRNKQLGELARFISDLEGPILLIGDLNVSPWSPFFKDLLRSTGLHDSREGFGLQPTWPTWLPLAWIPIDHALVSSSVVVHDRRVGPNVGSDHYPVIIDFSITPERMEQGAKNETSRQQSDVISQEDRKEKSKPRFDYRVMMGPRLRVKSKI